MRMTDEPTPLRPPGRGVPQTWPARLAALGLSLLFLAGCAGMSNTGPVRKIDDPFESANRAVFHLNYKFNKHVMLPVAWVYVNYVPIRMRLGLHNVLENVESPVTFANDILQGEVSRAGETLVRFTLNSSLGLGGLLDVGNAWGIAPHEADFGQTLALYGVPRGQVSLQDLEA